MIKIDNPRQQPPASVLNDNGGFLWWYAEAVDDMGNGVVLIWSFGLPFLPGYMNAARAGRDALPVQNPSIALAVYEEHTLSAYVLHRLQPQEVHWSGDYWKFGDTEIRQEIVDGQCSLEAKINIPVMSRRDDPVEGVLRVTGSSPKWGEHPIESDTMHHWTPLALPAYGSVRVRTGKELLCACGRAYYDRNWSDRPLDQLGIAHWVWGRVACAAEDRVFYALWPEGGGEPVLHGFEFSENGVEYVSLEAEWQGARRTLFGMSTWKKVTLLKEGEPWAEFSLTTPVDDGPFYLRYLVEGGTLEVITPSRIDMDIHRPLVRMRVSSDARNSIWLPLFQGFRRGRVPALLRSMVGARNAR